MEYIIIEILLGIIFLFVPQILVKTVFTTYKTERNSIGLTGAKIAEELLKKKGVSGVTVICLDEVESSASGNSRRHRKSEDLSDYYDPQKRRICLSSDVYNGNSIAAMAVAAHETGHAIQHEEADSFFSIRSLIAPIALKCSQFWSIILIIGVGLNMIGIIKLAGFIFMGVIVFHLITLPVELGASSRARTMLLENGYLRGDEEKGVKAVLYAAAFTYLAVALYSIMYFLMILKKR